MNTVIGKSPLPCRMTTTGPDQSEIIITDFFHLLNLRSTDATLLKAIQSQKVTVVSSILTLLN